MDKLEITTHAEGPVNDAFLALNHYISTGDHIGEGIALPFGDRLGLMVPYAPRELEDVDNWRRLEARLVQMQAEGFRLSIEEQPRGAGKFRLMVILVSEADLPDFTKRLRAEPGPLGWGSLYTFLVDNNVIPRSE